MATDTGTGAELPAHLAPLGRAFVRGLDAALGTNLAGVYLYGALTFPDAEGWTADFDFHVFVPRPFSDADRALVADVHHRLALEFPNLGDDTDGYYILLDDARSIFPP